MAIRSSEEALEHPRPLQAGVGGDPLLHELLLRSRLELHRVDHRGAFARSKCKRHYFV